MPLYIYHYVYVRSIERFISKAMKMSSVTDLLKWCDEHNYDYDFTTSNDQSLDWCGKPLPIPIDKDMLFRFRDENQAAHFKLVWG